jgi:hypothetical protein
MEPTIARPPQAVGASSPRQVDVLIASAAHHRGQLGALIGQPPAGSCASGGASAVMVGTAAQNELWFADAAAVVALGGISDLSPSTLMIPTIVAGPLRASASSSQLTGWSRSGCAAGPGTLTDCGPTRGARTGPGHIRAARGSTRRPPAGRAPAVQVAALCHAIQNPAVGGVRQGVHGGKFDGDQRMARVVSLLEDSGRGDLVRRWGHGAAAVYASAHTKVTLSVAASAVEFPPGRYTVAARSPA